MGRKFASQAHLGLITWDGRESFESHVVQDWFSYPGLDGSRDQNPIFWGIQVDGFITGYIWVIQVFSHLSSIRCTQTRVLFGALGRHQAATERKQ